MIDGNLFGVRELAPALVRHWRQGVYGSTRSSWSGPAFLRAEVMTVPLWALTKLQRQRKDCSSLLTGEAGWGWPRGSQIQICGALVVGGHAITPPLPFPSRGGSWSAGSSQDVRHSPTCRTPREAQAG